MNQLRIDPELRDKLISHLTDDELNQLREIPDKAQAFEWMCKQLLAPKRLTNEQRTALIGAIYETRRHDSKVRNGNQSAEYGTNRISEQISQEFDVGKNTVLRAAKFYRAIIAIREKSQQAADKILMGKSGIAKRDISLYPLMTSTEQEEFIKKASSGAPTKTHNPDGNTRADRAIRLSIQGIKEDMYADTTPVFGLKDLINELETGADAFIRQIRLTVISRPELLTAYRVEISNVISGIADNIIDFKEDLGNERI